MGQLSLEKTFLIAAYVEAIIYGLFFCIFCTTMLLYFTPGDSRGRERHTNVMICISAVMFFFATFHMVMNAWRLCRGYIDFAHTPGGPTAYIGDIQRWDHVLKDVLFANQENLGSAAAIYRVWVLWNKNWYIIVVPMCLLVVNIIGEFYTAKLYTQISPTESIFTIQLVQWIKAFYSVAVVLNVICTSLMIYRIWATHKKSAAFNSNKGQSRLLYVVRILVESAALQLIAEVVVLALYSANNNAQFILLESVASIVGITFNLVTIRLRLHAIAETVSSSQHAHPVQTFGSVPLRRIHVNISKDVEQRGGDHDNSLDDENFDKE